MPFAAKDFLGPVVGLTSDIAFRVFKCPHCKTEVTVSRWQAAGELLIMCARCNCRYDVKGDELIETAPSKAFAGYKVFVKGEPAQLAQPVPKDSYLQFVKDGMKWAKPAPPPAAAPKPAAPAAPAAPPAPAPDAPPAGS